MGIGVGGGGLFFLCWLGAHFERGIKSFSGYLIPSVFLCFCAFLCVLVPFLVFSCFRWVRFFCDLKCFLLLPSVAPARLEARRILGFSVLSFLCFSVLSYVSLSFLELSCVSLYFFVVLWVHFLCSRCGACGSCCGACGSCVVYVVLVVFLCGSCGS